MTAVPGRGGLLADIRGGAKLKKVSDQEKRDRSAAAVPGAEPSSPGASGSAAGGAAAGGGMAGALASALAARKAKVSHSGEYCPLLILVESGVLIGLQMMRRMMMIGERSGGECAICIYALCLSSTASRQENLGDCKSIYHEICSIEIACYLSYQ